MPEAPYLTRAGPPMNGKYAHGPSRPEQAMEEMRWTGVMF
jgi:hypothetical protein